MMRYLVLLLLPACFLCAVEDRSSAQETIVAFKVKRDAVFEPGESLKQDSGLFESEVHSREKRSNTEKKSYIFLDNRSGKTAKLYWRDIWTKAPATYYTSLATGLTIGLNTYANHEWTVKDESGGNLMINNRRGIIQKQNTKDKRSIALIKRPGQRNTDIGDRYVEMMVMVDKAAVDRHRNEEELKRYVLTYLKLATSILQHRDLTQHGIRLHLVLSKLVLLRRDLNDVKLDPKEGENNLRKVCNYMNKIGNAGPRRYDHKLFLTKNGFGMGGYANTRGMCSQYTSCSMVYDHGFTASFLVAHEIAHTFGADDRDFGQNSGYVMSRMVDARFDVHNWSTYSQISLLQNIRRYKCTENKPVRLENVPFVHKYPGVHYSFAQQCHLEYDKDYSEFTGGGDPCGKLKCRMPPPYHLFAKSSGSPALDGTNCGTNKWCLSGKCTTKTGALASVKETTVAIKTPPPRVDGGWGDWGQWSRCSRTCSTGVQARDRTCNKPLPRNGGRYCVGKSVEVRKCDTRKVCPNRLSEKDAVCSAAGRKVDARRRWKFYDDSTANLDCTFEKGTCAWSNDKNSGLKPWTLYRGRTPSLNTGPSVDYTLKTSKGQYIYFESSTPTKAKAVLSSPLIKARQGCLQFSYHMRGDHTMGQLKVIKVSRGISTVLWKKSGNQGNRWYRHSINVQNAIPYKLSFLAKKKGRGYNSDIALDDITFRSGLCSSSSATQSKVEENPCKIKCITSDYRNPTRIMSPISVYDGTTCATKTTTGVCYQGTCKTVGCDNILTDGTKDNCIISKGRRQSKTQESVGPISRNTKTKTRTTTTTRSKNHLDCDFERNLCYWANLAAKGRSNIRGSKLNWYRQRESRRKGYYLRIRQSGSSQSRLFVGSIASPEVKIPRACLTFSYKLSIKGAYARLRVKALERYGNQEYSRTKRTLPVTENWKEAKIDIQTSRPYKAVFEATLFRRHTGIIGIDNIHFNPGKCSSNKG